MEKELNIKVLLGMRKDKTLTTEVIEDLWYDWFCKRESILNKGKSLLSKLQQVVKANNNKFDPEKTYTFFKNNCPMRGSLYDDFRICDIETGKVLYTVTPKTGHNSNKGNSELWGKDNDFEKPLIDGAWEEVLNYFSK